MPVAKAELALLLLCCISFALIDPPTAEVDAHNTAIAPQEVLHYNALNMGEREPTLDDPTIFLYAKVLTLTPSVNGSVTSKPHPKLIWLAAEKHAPSVTETSGGDDCDRRTVTRNFDDAVLEGATADYALDGLIKQQGNVTTFNTASKSVVLATNETFVNPSDVPFGRSIAYQLLSLLNKLLSYVLGDMIDLSKYEESLAYASPYPTGTYNLTVRNVTIVNPHLNVTLTARFSINYTEHGTQQYEENGSCKTESWDDEGVLTLSDSDFDSYEVQNDYITIIPYMPGLLSLDANTTEDVTYHVSVLSNSNLYKYYSVMDNRTAGAYYFNSFEVVNDSFGISRIVAVPSNHSGLLAEDNRSNYTGGHQLLYALYGNVLRSPTEFNNMTYNYSKIYDIDEIFYNLSAERHNATLEYYTWFGNYSAPSAIDVRAQTILTLSAYPSGQDVSAFCTLTSRGVPVPGERVEFKLGDRTVRTSTDAMGRCNATLPNNMSGLLTVYGTFPGSSQLWPSDGMATVAVQGSIGAWKGVFIDNLALLLLISGLFAISFVGFMAGQGALGGGQVMGNVFSRFFPFAPRGVPKGKEMIRVKKGKELAVSVAMALATGGAGAAAGSKIAGEVAKKKLAGDAAKKSLEMRMKRELAEKGKKGKGIVGLKKASDKGAQKVRSRVAELGGTKKGGAAVPGDEEKKRKQTKIDAEFNDPHTTLERKKELAAQYLDTPENRLALRDKLKKEDIDLPFDRLTKETAAVIEAKDGGESARAYLESVGSAGVKLDLPSMGKWQNFEKVDPELAKAAGLTFGDDRIKISAHLVQLYENENLVQIMGGNPDAVQAELKMTAMHESIHTVATKIRYENQPLCDGFAETEAYRILQQSGASQQIKGAAHLTADYREYCATSYLTERIVGREEYIYAQTKGGESHLKEKFDKIAGEGKYEYIFHGELGEKERIDQLKRICKHDANIDFNEIQGNVKTIIKEGKYEA